MIRASAMYISLIISVLIVLVCSAMLMIGYTYKMQEKIAMRRQHLRRNLESGIVMSLDRSCKTDTTMTLGFSGDSISVRKTAWGLYMVAVVKSWRTIDTLAQALMTATAPEDTLKALYLADEDRPLAISGQSKITGSAYLPKSGIKAAYVEGEDYQGKALVYGKTIESARALPEPEPSAWIQLPSWAIKETSTAELKETRTAFMKELLSISNSFLKPVHEIRVHGTVHITSGTSLSGNLIIRADSMIKVDGGATLNAVLLLAPYIRIEEHFKGNLQAFATDSIFVGNGVTLRYPSALVVLKPDTALFQAKITISRNSEVAGQIIAWEKERSLLMPTIKLDSGSVVKGEIWSKGYVQLARRSRVQGSLTAIRLMANVSGAIYENYLIDVLLNRNVLSKYYLAPKLITRTKVNDKVLWWLN